MSKWEMVRLGELFDIGSSKRVFQSEWRDSGIPFYRAREIAKLANAGYVNNELFIDEKMYEEYSKKYGIPTEGDIMVTGVGTLGVCYIVKSTDKFYFKDGNILWFKKFSNVESSYVSWLFHTNYMKEQIKRHSSGTTVGTFTISTAKEIQIPIPPLKIQKKIARTLDTISELIALRKKQLAELDNLIKSTFYDMFGDPVVNEKGWEVKRLDDICIINPTKKEIINLPKNTEVSFLRMTDVSENGHISLDASNVLSEVEKGFTYFAENDVLFAKITPCMENGKGAVAKGLINKIGFGSTEFHVLRPKYNLCNSQWLYHLTMLDTFRKEAEQKMTGSAGQKRVPMGFIKSYRVPLPPISVQNQFAEIVTKIEEQKALVQKAVNESQYLFDSLMSEYFG